MNDDIKEAVIKILEILSTVATPDNVTDDEGCIRQCQYVIDEVEVKQCKELLERIDPGNQQLRH